jgi:DNA recombination protein RmuC
MESYIIPIIISIITLVLGYVIGTLIAKNKQSELEVRNKLLLEDKESNLLNINSLNEDKQNLNNERHELDLRYTQKVLELENLQEKLNENKAEVEQLQEKFTKDFEILANKILDKNSTKFTLQNKDHLKSILEPLQEKIQNFEKKVEDTHKESIESTGMPHYDSK